MKILRGSAFLLLAVPLLVLITPTAFGHELCEFPGGLFGLCSKSGVFCDASGSCPLSRDVCAPRACNFEDIIGGGTSTFVDCDEGLAFHSFLEQDGTNLSINIPAVEGGIFASADLGIDIIQIHDSDAFTRVWEFDPMDFPDPARNFTCDPDAVDDATSGIFGFCKKNRDCDSGATCSSGVCRFFCDDDSDCSGNLDCRPAGFCALQRVAFGQANLFFHGSTVSETTIVFHAEVHGVLFLQGGVGETQLHGSGRKAFDSSRNITRNKVMISLRNQ